MSFKIILFIWFISLLDDKSVFNVFLFSSSRTNQLLPTLKHPKAVSPSTRNRWGLITCKLLILSTAVCLYLLIQGLEVQIYSLDASRYELLEFWHFLNWFNSHLLRYRESKLFQDKNLARCCNLLETLQNPPFCDNALLFFFPSWTNSRTWFPSTRWPSKIWTTLSRKRSWTKRNILTGHTNQLLICKFTILTIFSEIYLPPREKPVCV